MDMYAIGELVNMIDAVAYAVDKCEDLQHMKIDAYHREQIKIAEAQLERVLRRIEKL